MNSKKLVVVFDGSASMYRHFPQLLTNVFYPFREILRQDSIEHLRRPESSTKVTLEFVACTGQNGLQMVYSSNLHGCEKIDWLQNYQCQGRMLKESDWIEAIMNLISAENGRFQNYT